MITVIVIAMVGIILFSVLSSKKDSKAENKLQFSETATVSAATVNGKIGEAKLPTFDSQANDTAIGKIVPQITAETFSGKTETVAPGKKPYVLALVAHWCPHCQKEVPKIVSLYEQGQLPEDVDFIAVATGTSESKPNYPPSEWLNNSGWPWLKLADDKNFTIGNGLGLQSYPYLIYVNADGTIYKRTSGEKEDTEYIADAKAISKAS